MIYCCKLDFSKQKIDLVKTTESRKCDKCGFNFFIGEHLKLHPELFTCKERLNLLIKADFSSSFCIEKINEKYYWYCYSEMTKEEIIEYIKKCIL